MSSDHQQMPNLKVFDEGYNDMLLTKVVHSNKAGFDLIQNCDLPPPMKILSKSSGNTTGIMSNMMRKNMRSHNQEGNEDGGNSIGVLKALRLSQTRAREAEAKYASISKEMDSLVVALIEDSMQVFGYRQLLRLLEFQVSQLQQRTQCGCCDCEKIVENEVDDDGDDGNNGSNNGVIWVMGLAFCLGVAGFGFTIGCKYGVLF